MTWTLRWTRLGQELPYNALLGICSGSIAVIQLPLMVKSWLKRLLLCVT